MITVTRIKYTDDSNHHHDFPAQVEKEDCGYIVRVYPNEELLGKPVEFVEIALRETENGRLQVVASLNPVTQWSNHIGLVTNTLLHCSRLFAVDILSSPPNSSDRTEWRSTGADMMWERLVERGMALKILESGQYFIPIATS